MSRGMCSARVAREKPLLVSNTANACTVCVESKQLSTPSGRPKKQIKRPCGKIVGRICSTLCLFKISIRMKPRSISPITIHIVTMCRNRHLCFQPVFNKFSSELYVRTRAFIVPTSRHTYINLVGVRSRCWPIAHKPQRCHQSSPWSQPISMQSPTGCEEKDELQLSNATQPPPAGHYLTRNVWCRVDKTFIKPRNHLNNAQVRAVSDVLNCDNFVRGCHVCDCAYGSGRKIKRHTTHNLKFQLPFCIHFTGQVAVLKSRK